MPGVLCLVILADLVWLAVVGRWIHIDEIGYKGPGLALLTRGTFEISAYRGIEAGRAGAVPGHNGFFVVYPALFAGWAKLWGFSRLSCVLFDGMVHGAVVLVAYGIWQALFPHLSRVLALAPALLLLLVGSSGRADDLSCFFALLGVFLLLQPRPGLLRPALAGASFALGFMTQPQAAFLLAPLCLLTVGLGARERKLPRAAAFGAAALGVLAASFAPAWLAHPEVVQHFKRASADYVGRKMTGLPWQSGAFNLLLTLPLAACGALDVSLLRSDPRRWCRLWLGPMLAVALLIVLMPDRRFYFWFPVPWLLVVAIGRLAEQRREGVAPGVRASQLALIAIAVLGGIVPNVRAALIMATLPAEQRLGVNEQIVRELVPPGTRVVSLEFWPTLAGDHEVYHPEFSNLTAGDIDYVILTGGGSGALGKGQGWPQGVPPDGFEQIHDNLNRSPNSVLGVPLSRSGYGYGTMIYRRRDLSPSGAR